MKMEISENVEIDEEEIKPKKIIEEESTPKKQQAEESESEGKISKAQLLINVKNNYNCMYKFDILRGDIICKYRIAQRD